MSVHTSPWLFRPIGVFSGRKYNRKPVSTHCSFLSFQTIRSSARHVIAESDHGRTGIHSPSARTNGLSILLKRQAKQFDMISPFHAWFRQIYVNGLPFSRRCFDNGLCVCGECLFIRLQSVQQFNVFAIVVILVAAIHTFAIIVCHWLLVQLLLLRRWYLYAFVECVGSMITARSANHL